MSIIRPDAALIKAQIREMNEKLHRAEDSFKQHTFLIKLHGLEKGFYKEACQVGYYGERRRATREVDWEGAVVKRTVGWYYEHVWEKCVGSYKVVQNIYLPILTWYIRGGERDGMRHHKIKEMLGARMSTESVAKWCRDHPDYPNDMSDNENDDAEDNDTDIQTDAQGGAGDIQTDAQSGAGDTQTNAQGGAGDTQSDTHVDVEADDMDVDDGGRTGQWVTDIEDAGTEFDFDLSRRTSLQVREHVQGEGGTYTQQTHVHGEGGTHTHQTHVHNEDGPYRSSYALAEGIRTWFGKSGDLRWFSTDDVCECINMDKTLLEKCTLPDNARTCRLAELCRTNVVRGCLWYDDIPDHILAALTQQKGVVDVDEFVCHLAFLRLSVRDRHQMYLDDEWHFKTIDLDSHTLFDEDSEHTDCVEWFEQSHEVLQHRLFDHVVIEAGVHPESMYRELSQMRQRHRPWCKQSNILGKIRYAQIAWAMVRAMELCKDAYHLDEDE